jgi:hypothetical protein
VHRHSATFISSPPTMSLTWLVRRLVAPDVQMLRGERSIMRGHLSVMMFRKGIGRVFGAPFEHFRSFLKDFGLGHDPTALPSAQAGEVNDCDGERRTHRPEGGVPAA